MEAYYQRVILRIIQDDKYINKLPCIKQSMYKKNKC